MKKKFVIGFSNFFTHLRLFSLFHFYFSLSQLFFPSHSLLLLPSLFPLFFSLSFISLFLFLPFKLTLPLLRYLFWICVPIILLFSFFNFMLLLMHCLFTSIKVVFLFFVVFLFQVSTTLLLACFKVLFVPINVACDVGSNVNWLTN